MKHIRDYLGRLVGEWIGNKVLLALDLVALVSILILGRDLSSVRWVAVAVLLLSYFAASYSLDLKQESRIAALEEQVAELTRMAPARIIWKLKESSFEFSGWEAIGRVPKDRPWFYVLMYVRNQGDERGRIIDARLSDFSVGTDLLTDRLSLSWDYRPRGSSRWEDLDWSRDILGAGAWWEVRCFVYVKLSERHAPKFAARLHELDSYEMIFSYSYEGFSGASGSASLRVEGSFAHFKDRIVSEWKDRQYQDLLLASGQGV